MNSFEDCEHLDKTAHWDYLQCNFCGGVLCHLIGSEPGAEKKDWFESQSDYRYYKKFGVNPSREKILTKRIETLEAAIREHKKKVIERVSDDPFMQPKYDKDLWSVLEDKE